MDFFPQPEHDIPFEVDEPFKLAWHPQPDQSPSPSWFREHTLWITRLGVGLVAGLLLLFGAHEVFRGGEEKQAPFVFFEVRAIDPSGHPVAGAKISVASEDTGDVTDSFGEWRRYMRVPLGKKVAVQVDKVQKNGLWSGRKEVLVPAKRPKESELEVKTSIQIGPAGRVPPVQPIKSAQASRNVVDEAAVLDRENLSEPDIHINERQFSEVVFDLQKVAVERLKPSLRGWARVYNEDLTGALYRRAQQNGLRVKTGSSLRVQLRFLPVDGEKTVVESIVSWRDDKDSLQSTSFLKNMNATADTMAQTILNAVRLHVSRPYLAYQDHGRWFVVQPQKGKQFWGLQGQETLVDGVGKPFSLARDNQGRLQLMTGKSSPCGEGNSVSRCVVYASTTNDNPPAEGWQPLRVKIPVNAVSDLRVYVAGYWAHPVGGHVWEYWGQPGGEASVLLLKGNQIVSYQKIRDIPHGLAQISSKTLTVASRK